MSPGCKFIKQANWYENSKNQSKKKQKLIKLNYVRRISFINCRSHLLQFQYKRQHQPCFMEYQREIDGRSIFEMGHSSNACIFFVRSERMNVIQFNWCESSTFFRTERISNVENMKNSREKGRKKPWKMPWPHWIFDYK